MCLKKREHVFKKREHVFKKNGTCVFKKWNMWNVPQKMFTRDTERYQGLALQKQTAEREQVSAVINLSRQGE